MSASQADPIIVVHCCSCRSSWQKFGPAFLVTRNAILEFPDYARLLYLVGVTGIDKLWPGVGKHSVFDAIH